MKNVILFVFISLLLSSPVVVTAQNCPAIASYNLVTVSNDGSNNCTYRVDFTMTVNGSNKSVQIVVTCDGSNALTQCIVVNSGQNGLTLSSAVFSCSCNSVKSLVINSFTNGSCGGGNCVSTGNVLPTVFTGFTGLRQKEQTCLNWQVGNPANIAYFIVEQSADGQQFTQAAQAAGGGMANHFSTCTITSPTAGYFRVKAVELNGRIVYSDIIKLKKEADRPGITPNPVQNRLYISSVVTPGSHFRIRSMNGSIAGAGIITGNSVDVQLLSPGLYLLDVISGTTVSHASFVKQ
jgi:hypothetical protein